MITENNELQIGIFSRQEFSKWRGVSENTIKTRRKKYLEELSIFADFHLEGKQKQIYIDKVHIPVYSKETDRLVNEIAAVFREKIWDKSGIDTVSHAAAATMELFSISNYNRAYRLTALARTKLYGKVNSPAGGHLGKAFSIWTNKKDDKYFPLTAAEQKIFKTIFHVFFNNVEDYTLLVQELVDSAAIAKADAWDTFINLIGLNKNSYKALLKELRDTHSIYLVKATEVKDWGEVNVIENLSLDDTIEEKEIAAAFHL
jgi:hypothetical protein